MAYFRNKSNHIPRPSRGFTLIEMLIVLVVLAIIGVMAIPSSHDGQLRLRLAADRLITDIEFAQLASIGKADDRRVIVFDLVEQRYFLASESDTAQPITHPVTGNPYTQKLGSTPTSSLNGVGLHNVEAGGDGMVSFGVHGALDESGPVTIVLSSGSDLLTVSIDPDTGKASVLE